jgi:hypothetical protein
MRRSACFGLDPSLFEAYVESEARGTPARERARFARGRRDVAASGGRHGAEPRRTVIAAAHTREEPIEGLSSARVHKAPALPDGSEPIPKPSWLRDSCDGKAPRSHRLSGRSRDTRSGDLGARWPAAAHSVPFLFRVARQRVSAARSAGPPRSHTRARAPGATGDVQLRPGTHRPWPSWPTTPARERSGWAGKSGRSRACSGLTSIGRSRRTTQRSKCSSAVAAAQAHLDLARTGRSSRASKRRRGACTGWCPAERCGASADRRRSELCGLPDRSRVFGPKRARGLTRRLRRKTSRCVSSRNARSRRFGRVPVENAGIFPETRG